MPQKFTDSHATRIISALDDRAARKNKDGAQIQTTWGTVGAVDAGNKFASAYLYGETDGAYLSAGFRIPETTYLSVGQVVKVNINYATGERWIDEVHPPVTAHKKIAIDTSTGELRQGNGSAQPAVVSFANLPILATITAFIQTLLDDVDAATARATLGLGSFATLSSLAHSATTGQTATDHHAAPVAGPDANITIDAAGAAGTASTFARSAHGHQLVTSSATPAMGSVAGSAGTSTTAPSRGNHAHPRTDPVVRVYTSGATWTKPSNLSHVFVEVVGGGGGGAGAVTNAAGSHSKGSGGGSGSYSASLRLEGALGSTVTVTVGGGGGGGTTTGSNGSASSFGSHATTNGGIGGAHAGSSSATWGIRGSAGGASGSGDITSDGQASEGGFGGAGLAMSGHGAPGPWGGGGTGGSSGSQPAQGAGVAGSGYGAGGGGAFCNGAGTASSGGAGAGGVVIVYEYYL